MKPKTKDEIAHFPRQFSPAELTLRNVFIQVSVNSVHQAYIGDRFPPEMRIDGQRYEAYRQGLALCETFNSIVAFDEQLHILEAQEAETTRRSAHSAYHARALPIQQAMAFQVQNIRDCMVIATNDLSREIVNPHMIDFVRDVREAVRLGRV